MDIDIPMFLDVLKEQYRRLYSVLSYRMLCNQCLKIAADESIPSETIKDITLIEEHIEFII